MMRTTCHGPLAVIIVKALPIVLVPGIEILVAVFVMVIIGDKEARPISKAKLEITAVQVQGLREDERLQRIEQESPSGGDEVFTAPHDHTSESCQ